MKNKYGLLIENPKEEDYIFGASPLPYEELQADASDWYLKIKTRP